MKQLIKAVMLPTEDDVQPPFVSIRQNRYGDWDDFPIYQTNKHDGRDNPHYVYITVPQDVEPIKKGDWFIQIHQGTKSLVKCDTQNKDVVNTCQSKFLKAFKIIATTDPKLINSEWKSHYTSEESFGVAKVQQSFLKEFVKNPDGEWEVDYNTCPIGPNGNVIGTNQPYPYDELICNFTIVYKLKLNQDNEVDITSNELANAAKFYRDKTKEMMYSKEEKMYSRDEVESLLFQYAEDEHAWFSSKSEIESFNEWIKENL